MATKDKLFTQIFAPKNLEQMILPDRIKSVFAEERVNGHFLFHGNPGMGKSQLGRILCQKHPHKYVNASINGRIDTLREELIDFCMEHQMTEHEFGTRKVIFLDEIDGVSSAFFDGLRGFMDQFQDTVYFIGSCNNFSKIPEPIQSRFDCINFNFVNQEEENKMYDLYKAKMKFILGGCKIDYTDDILDALCKNNFPDYRGILQTIQRIHRSGTKNLTSDMVMSSIYEFIDLYKLILNPNSAPSDIHRTLMGDYAMKASEVISGLDRSFIKWILENQTAYEWLIPYICIIVAKHSHMQYNIDPTLCMKSCVFEIMEKIKNK